MRSGVITHWSRGHRKYSSTRLFHRPVIIAVRRPVNTNDPATKHIYSLSLTHTHTHTARHTHTPAEMNYALSALSVMRWIDVEVQTCVCSRVGVCGGALLRQE